MADDPVQAGIPRAAAPLRVYESGDIRVLWDPTRCIHTGICTHRLPQVFNTELRPWVDVDGAPAPDIATTIEACPTGALRYEGVTVEQERPADPTVIDIRPNGPIYIRGRLQVKRPGTEPVEETRVALCRCGASANKPYCDNSHRLIGFRDPPRPG